jgi:hypothetical protein
MAARFSPAVRQMTILVPGLRRDPLRALDQPLRELERQLLRHRLVVCRVLRIERPAEVLVGVRRHEHGEETAGEAGFLRPHHVDMTGLPALEEIPLPALGYGPIKLYVQVARERTVSKA